MLGTAAYGLTSRLDGGRVLVDAGEAAIVSVNPRSGSIRGGAVGNSA